jgi:hypothetical protein
MLAPYINCMYIYVAIHALASMPSAPRLSEADIACITFDISFTDRELSCTMHCLTFSKQRNFIRSGNSIKAIIHA